jgi:DinB superfamily
MDANDQLSSAVQDQLAAYFEHVAARVGRYARALPHDKLWANPFAFGNSVGHLIVHLTGSLNHYIGAGIAGTGYVRDRPGEFAAVTGRSSDEVLAPFNDTINMVVQTLRSQGSDGLMTPVLFGEPPVQNRFGLFLVCAAHINNHVGQMAYLMHAHGFGSDEQVW